MTREEAKAWLEHHFDPIPDGTKQSEAVSLAIKALEQEPVLDKIRAEIEQLADANGYGDYLLGYNFGLIRAVQIIVLLGYNFGLMRAVQIIDKYTGEEV